MCGIVGAVGKSDVMPILLDGLKRLEYRGYDSAGIAVIDNNEISRTRSVGNFVETKNSRILKGSKVNHLSYVGDSKVGTSVNIGAGVITCNYDGANKHRTHIGNNVFVGSDSQLVAPVKIADGATIGAGSTITDNVEGNALAVSRARQRSVRNWKRPQKNTGGKT